MVRVYLLLIYFFLIPWKVLAYEVPVFPACAAPSGELIASYDSGTHGIVGSGDTYSGSDRVYSLPNANYLQCFCPQDGNGIQTNWLSMSDLSGDNVKSLESQGWDYVGSGDSWGLSDGPYLAQNISYSCLSRSPQPSSTPSSSSGNSSSNVSSQDNGIGGGEDEGEVLGLAATGNTLTLVAVFSLSLFALIAGIRRLKG